MTAIAAGEARPRGEVGYPSPQLVRLIPLQPELPDPDLVAWLAGRLAELLSTEVIVAEPLPAAPAWWTSAGGQLDSGAIVDTLVERLPESEGKGAAVWHLAITAADLRGGHRDFVFGEAAMGGSWAVVGTARFGAPGESRFRTRVLTEALHELGHLAGLDHCRDPECLMTASRDVDGLDRKGHVLCNGCRSTRVEAGP